MFAKFFKAGAMVVLYANLNKNFITFATFLICREILQSLCRFLQTSKCISVISTCFNNKEIEGKKLSNMVLYYELRIL